MDTKEYGVSEFIRELIPDATEEERNIAGERLRDYIRILMRMAERMERENKA